VCGGCTGEGPERGKGGGGEGEGGCVRAWLRPCVHAWAAAWRLYELTRLQLPDYAQSRSCAELVLPQKRLEIRTVSRCQSENILDWIAQKQTDNARAGAGGSAGGRRRALPHARSDQAAPRRLCPVLSSQNLAPSNSATQQLGSSYVRDSAGRGGVNVACREQELAVPSQSRTLLAERDGRRGQTGRWMETSVYTHTARQTEAQTSKQPGWCAVKVRGVQLGLVTHRIEY